MPLNDDHCPDAIRHFVRNNSDIEVYEYIERGLSGEVYFGKRKKLDDEVVLKFYWAQKDYDASEEAVILRNIKHPNILEVFDLRFIPPYFALFLSLKISGGDLQGIIEERPISSREALEYMAGILKGITELHSVHNLVHRDLKPGNVLVDLKSNQPIIADLGAVKKLLDATGHVTASKATRLYLPPESVLQNKYYYQSDIYQIGLIMFQLLGGKFPINNPSAWLNKIELRKIEAIKNSIQRDNTLYEMLDDKIAKGKIADTSTLPIYLDGGFKKVVNKALNTDHSLRFSNSSDFLKEIHKLLRNFPDYKKLNDALYITHASEKEYRIIETGKKAVLEKRISGKDWRKDNSHNGTFLSALATAKEANK